MAATIQTDGETLEISYRNLEELIEDVLGDTIKLEDISLKLLASTQHLTWLLTSSIYTRRNMSRLSIQPRAVSIPVSPVSDLSRRAKALLENVVNSKEIANATDSEGDQSSDDEDRYISDPDQNHKSVKKRRNRAWESLEEQRVLAWRKEGLSWEEMANKLVGRSKGAVYLRWYTKLRRDEDE